MIEAEKSTLKRIEDIKIKRKDTCYWTLLEANYSKTKLEAEKLTANKDQFKGVQKSQINHEMCL